MDLNNLSKAISKALNAEIVITSIDKIGEGLHSDGYKLTASNGRKFFLKKNKSYDLGFSIPERKFYSLMLGHRMSNRVKKNPKSIGVFVENKGEIKEINEFKDDDIFYNIQEFEEGGVNYFKLLEDKSNKLKIDEKDKEEINKIVDYLVNLHSIKYPSTDENLLKIIYNDSLRTIITHPELNFTFLHNFDKNNSILPIEKQKEILSLMLEQMHQWKNRSDRLSAIHGDFWGANIFFKENGEMHVIDHSRIPWGDSGIDISWFVQQFIWFYLKKNNIYYKELGNYFLKEYENKSKDLEIRKSLILPLAVISITAIPSKPSNQEEEISKKYIEIVLNMVKSGEFNWC